MGGTQIANQLRLGAGRDLVQDVDLEAVLDADEGGEHADRAGAGTTPRANET